MSLPEDVEEARLRSYLLGGLSEGERREIEERIFTDGDFAQHLITLEDEVIDDFLDGLLSEEEQRGFETLFLQGSGDRREKVKLAQALQSRARAERAREHAVGSFSRPLGWLSTLPAAATLLIAAASIAALAALGGYFLQPSDDEARFTLEPGTLRGGGSMQRVEVPAERASVELRLVLDSDRFDSYRAALHDADGRELLAWSDLSSHRLGDRNMVRLFLASESLGPGDYDLRLSGTRGAELEPLDSYVFRVPR